MAIAIIFEGSCCDGICDAVQCISNVPPTILQHFHTHLGITNAPKLSETTATHSGRRSCGFSFKSLQPNTSTWNALITMISTTRCCGAGCGDTGCGVVLDVGFFGAECHQPVYRVIIYALVSRCTFLCTYNSCPLPNPFQNHPQQEMLKLNFIRNLGSIGADELIGRCKVPLKEICANPGQRELVKAALGTEEFSNFEGCVRVGC